jgi:hypothetical protein
MTTAYGVKMFKNTSEGKSCTEIHQSSSDILQAIIMKNYDPLLPPPPK